MESSRKDEVFKFDGSSSSSKPIPIKRPVVKETMVVGSPEKTLSPFALFAKEGKESLPSLILPPAAPLIAVVEKDGSESDSESSRSSSSSSDSSDDESSSNDEESRPQSSVAAASNGNVLKKLFVQGK